MLRVAARQLAKKYQPLGARVLIARDVQKTQTDAGIIIPESSTKKLNEGNVVAVGPQVETIKPGNKVLLPEWGGVGIDVSTGPEKEQQWLFKEEDILAIIE
mmetsp:Transcript_140472/g.199128  ORF Transcript_140472/g.199128 Transcript_140472/m.199128 type:complete len:101 (-) Transcript_140472:217-519(-)